MHKWKILTWDSDFPSLSLLVSQGFNIPHPPRAAHSARGRGPPERESPGFTFSKSFRHTFKCKKLRQMRLDNSNSSSIQEQFQTGLCASHWRASTTLEKITNTYRGSHIAPIYKQLTLQLCIARIAIYQQLIWEPWLLHWQNRRLLTRAFQLLQDPTHVGGPASKN